MGLTIDVANKKKYPLPSLTPLLRVDTADESPEIKTLDKKEVIIAGKASNSLENEFISRIGTETNLKPKDKIEIVIEYYEYFAHFTYILRIVKMLKMQKTRNPQMNSQLNLRKLILSIYWKLSK